MQEGELVSSDICPGTSHVLDQMYKLYIRLHLDYGDINYRKYDSELNLNFTKKLEATQYTAALAVSGTELKAGRAMVDQGPSGPLLPEKTLDILNMLNIEKDRLF